MSSTYLTIAVTESDAITVVRNPKSVDERNGKLQMIADYCSPEVIRKAPADELRAMCNGLVDTTEVIDGKHKRRTKQQLADALIKATEARRQERAVLMQAFQAKVTEVFSEQKMTRVESDLVNLIPVIQADPVKAVQELLEHWSNLSQHTITKSYSPEVNKFMDTKAVQLLSPEQVSAFKQAWNKIQKVEHTKINQTSLNEREQDGFNRREVAGAPVITWAVEQLQNPEAAGWKATAYALALVTGRRMGEVLGEQTILKADGSTHVFFYGQLKKEKGEGIEDYWYRLPVLCDSSLVIAAHEFLKSAGKPIQSNLVNTRYSKQLSTDLPKAIKSALKSLGIECFKDSRDFYAGVMVRLHKQRELNTNESVPPETNFVGGLLGHDNFFSATANYHKMRVLWTGTEVADPLDAEDLTQVARRSSC